MTMITKKIPAIGKEPRTLVDEIQNQRSKNMKVISYENAIQAIAKYVDKLAKERKLQPKKDDFTVVLPLEKHQAVIAEVGENDDGERQVSYQVTETVFLMKKMKNTVLSIFEEEDEA